MSQLNKGDQVANITKFTKNTLVCQIHGSYRAPALYCITMPLPPYKCTAAQEIIHVHTRVPTASYNKSFCYPDNNTTIGIQVNLQEVHDP